jgi:translation initiation factor IF-2
MSDIMVKQLAKTVGAPVDMLLKQLQDAGINVKGAEDSITNAEKLKLLQYIQGLTKKATIAKNAGNKKLGLKRRDNGALSGSRKQTAGKMVNVAVRRKKMALNAGKAVATAATATSMNTPNYGSRSALLAKQLDAERKAREQANLSRQTAMKTAPKKPTAPKTAKNTTVEAEAVKEKAPQEADAKAKETQTQAVKKATPPTKTSNTTDVTAQKPTATDIGKPKATPAIPSQTGVKKPISSKSPQHAAQGILAKKPVAKTDVKKPVVTKPTLRKTATTSKPAHKPNVVRKPTTAVKAKTAQTPTPAVRPPTLTSRLSLLNLGGGKERREAVAAKAKEEASSLLKRRPSRKIIKAAVKPAEKPTTEKKVVKPVAKAKPAAKTDDKKKQPKRLRNVGGAPLHLAGNKSKAKRRGRKARRQQQSVQIDDTKHQFEKPTAPVVREIEIPELIVVGDLAKELKVQAIDIIKVMMGMGVMATINQTLDQDTAILVVEEMGHKAKPLADVSDEAQVAHIIDNAEYELFPRPPVVTIMGHVDHGKTSLLDYIRESRVTAGEAGGITQHIGAYHVETDSGVITFLDTPGHAAFSEMRARGAGATDVVIIVVAADDGVMPQTKEAIKHTRAAGVPMIVAINKIDKDGADPERVKNELSQYEVVPEEWGGDDVFVNVSAQTGEGIDSLLENISLVAEILELKAPIEGAAKGSVVEASIEKGRGAVATVLVQSGTLSKGDFVLSGKEYGRVRALFNENGKPIKSAGPSIPVSVLGLSGAPMAGDSCLVVSDERRAKEIAEARRQQEKDSLFAVQQAAKLDAMFSKMKDGEKLEVPVLLKADVQGSIEALRGSLLNLSTDEVIVKIISSGVGGFNETDVNLAIASGAAMIGFNVRADASAKRIASESGAEIRYYSIIYEIIDDVRDAMSGLLAPELREEFVGLAEVKEVFRSSSFGAAAGCLVMDGTVKQGLQIRVLRDNVVVFEGELESLRRHKDLVTEVVSGTECGIAVKNYNDIEEGDQIECFKRTEVARTLLKD